MFKLTTAKMIVLKALLGAGLVVGILLVGAVGLLTVWDFTSNVWGVFSTLVALQRSGGLQVGTILILVFGVLALAVQFL